MQEVQEYTIAINFKVGQYYVDNNTGEYCLINKIEVDEEGLYPKVSFRIMNRKTQKFPEQIYQTSMYNLISYWEHIADTLAEFKEYLE